MGKKKHYTDQQIAFALRQAEMGAPVAEIIRKMGICQQTFYTWKKKGGDGYCRNSLFESTRRRK